MPNSHHPTQRYTRPDRLVGLGDVNWAFDFLGQTNYDMVLMYLNFPHRISQNETKFPLLVSLLFDSTDSPGLFTDTSEPISYFLFFFFFPLFIVVGSLR